MSEVTPSVAAASRLLPLPVSVCPGGSQVIDSFWCQGQSIVTLESEGSGVPDPDPACVETDRGWDL